MSARKKTSEGPVLFRSDNSALRIPSRRRKCLILPAFLAEEAQKGELKGAGQDRAYEMILKWADLDAQGHLLAKKETSLDAEFLRDIFCEALGYKTQTDSPEKWNLQRQFAIPDNGTADAAYFRLYGIKRDDAEYILSTFTGTRRRDESETGSFRTAELVLSAYDDLA